MLAQVSFAQIMLNFLEESDTSYTGSNTSTYIMFEVFLEVFDTIAIAILGI